MGTCQETKKQSGKYGRRTLRKGNEARDWTDEGKAQQLDWTEEGRALEHGWRSATTREANNYWRSGVERRAAGTVQEAPFSFSGGAIGSVAATWSRLHANIDKDTKRINWLQGRRDGNPPKGSTSKSSHGTSGQYEGRAW